METVSKKLSEIAKENGFDECCNSIYNLDELVNDTYMLWLNYNTLHGNRNSGNEQKYETFNYLSAPTYYQLINWIFNDGLSVTSKEANIHWLEFWYDTLIPEIQNNELVLEGFVGMLLNWFEKNNNYFHIDKLINNEKYKFHFQQPKLYQNSPLAVIYDSKYQARHEGIKQVFKLMKNDEFGTIEDVYKKYKETK